jgi:ZU5 domain
MLPAEVDMRNKSYFLALALALVAGCGGSSGVNITAMIGPNGGMASHSDGTSLNIPPGALATDTNITIQSVNVKAPPGTVLVGPAYDFGPEGTTFKAGVTITLPFEMSKIPMGRTASDILIYTAPKGGTQFTAMATSLASGVVTTQTTHFSVYLPAAPAANVATDLPFTPVDLGFTSCSPNCTTGSSSCGCTETCGGHTYVMMCSQSSSTAGCFCEIDNVTQSTSITGVTCDSLSAVEGGFFQGCGPS